LKAAALNLRRASFDPHPADPDLRPAGAATIERMLRRSVPTTATFTAMSLSAGSARQVKEGNIMKRTIIAAALLLGSMLTAHADTSFWDNITKHARSDAEMTADGRYCDLQTNGDGLGTTPTPAYKKCMLSRGWRYSHWQSDGTYVNRRGMLCHSILNGGGTECSSQ
jgi:hypothetical protein